MRDVAVLTVCWLAAGNSSPGRCCSVLEVADSKAARLKQDFPLMKPFNSILIVFISLMDVQLSMLT